MNSLGFACYTSSTATFLYSPVIRRQYADRHPTAPEPTVRFNDLAFGVHGVVLVVLTYSQFFPILWGFEVGKSQHASLPALGIIFGSLFSVLLVTLIVASGSFLQTGWEWIDVVYTLGYIKILATSVKYISQVRLNFTRKSTEGWSIWQILLDFNGGVLSLAQLIIDASLQDGWSGITGNPLKFGLGIVSIFFDVIFILQHYVFFRDQNSTNVKSPEERGTEPLLGNDEAVEFS